MNQLSETLLFDVSGSFLFLTVKKKIEVPIQNELFL